MKEARRGQFGWNAHPCAPASALGWRQASSRRHARPAGVLMLQKQMVDEALWLNQEVDVFIYSKHKNASKHQRSLASHLAFITDLAQQAVAPSDVGFPLYAFRGAAVDDPQHALALRTLSNDYFNRVSGCAKD